MKRDQDRVSNGFVWAAVGLSAIYVAIHLPMFFRSLMLWAGW